MTVSVRGTDNVGLEVWKPPTASVLEGGVAAKRQLAGSSNKPGTEPDTVRVRNQGKRGGYYYADIFPARGVGNASYTLTVKTARR